MLMLRRYKKDLLLSKDLRYKEKFDDRIVLIKQNMHALQSSLPEHQLLQQ